MPGMPGMPGMAGDLTILHRGAANARWTFTLPQKFRKLTFAEAGASAMAVGVFEDAAGNQRTFQWSETVLLTYGPVPAPALLRSLSRRAQACGPSQRSRPSSIRRRRPPSVTVPSGGIVPPRRPMRDRYV